jgi:cell division protein FtsB
MIETYNRNALEANLENLSNTIDILEATIEDLRCNVADQQDELKALVRFIKKFNHPEEYGHLLDRDAKQEVMNILSIYKEYDK